MVRSHSSSDSKSRASANGSNNKKKISQANKRTRTPTDHLSPNTSPEKKKIASEATVEDNTSSISSTQQTYRAPPPVNYQPQFTTPNPFDPIAPQDDNEGDMETAQDDIQVQNKPPIINIKSVKNFINVCKSISSVVGEQAFTCKARIDVLSIQASNSDNYRSIIKHLQAVGIEHYTYQFRNEKPYRVVIRHLHPSTPVELIKEELEKIGFSVIDACNVLQRSTRIPLPLFFVNLKPAPNNRDIFSLRSLLYTSIKIEEPHKKEDLPQCTRCQGFNHTRKYCPSRPAVSSQDAHPSYASALHPSPSQSTPLSQPQPPSNTIHRSSRAFIPPPNPSSDLTAITTALNLLIDNLKLLISPVTDLLQKVTSILSTLQP